MTDRISTITITLHQDTRTDDAEELISMLFQLKWVAAVQAGPVASPADIERHRARAALYRDLVTAIDKVLG